MFGILKNGSDGTDVLLDRLGMFRDGSEGLEIWYECLTFIIIGKI